MEEEQTTKKVRTTDVLPLDEKVIDVKKPVIKTERCSICKQYLDEVYFYNGHPNNAVDESVALTDDKLMLFTGDEEMIEQHDTRPINKVINNCCREVTNG